MGLKGFGMLTQEEHITKLYKTKAVMESSKAMVDMVSRVVIRTEAFKNKDDRTMLYKTKVVMESNKAMVHMVSRGEIRTEAFQIREDILIAIVVILADKNVT